MTTDAQSESRMPNRSVTDFTEDAISAIDWATSWTADVSLEAWSDDDIRRSAVERQVFIVSQALIYANDLDPTLANQVTDLRKLINLRDIVPPEPDNVNDALVWSKVTTFLPTARTALQRVLNGRNRSTTEDQS